MARSEDEIVDALYDLTPSWIERGAVWSELFYMVAAVYRLLEQTFESWTDILWRRTADGPYLTEYGEEDIGVERFPHETDEDYRAEAYIRSRSPTPAEIERAINRRLPHEGYSVEVILPNERVLMPADTDSPKHGVFLDGSSGLLTDVLDEHLIWVIIPAVEALSVGDRAAILGDKSAGGFLDWSAWIVGNEKAFDRLALLYVHEYFEGSRDGKWPEHRPAGVLWGASVCDTVELAYHDALLARTARPGMIA